MPSGHSTNGPVGIDNGGRCMASNVFYLEISGSVTLFVGRICIILRAY
jgi:hypothetical protein